MQSRHAEIQAAGAAVLAISVDPSATTREKLGSSGIEFPLLADPDLATIDAYGVRHPAAGVKGADIARPATFLIDAEGNIGWRELTDNWRIRLRPERLLEQLTAAP